MLRAFVVIIRHWENTLPNFVTLGRLLIFLWGLHVFYWWSWNPWYVLLFCVIGGGLDGVDGYLAKVLSQQSVSGKLLDPLVDKICGWNGATILVHYFTTQTELAVTLLFLPSLIPFALIGAYDLGTMAMRGTDERMTTNSVAKLKQLVLFCSLGILQLSVIFHDLAGGAREEPTYSAYFVTYVLVLIVGELVLWQALRMTVASARVYFRQTDDATALRWAHTPFVRWVLYTF